MRAVVQRVLRASVEVGDEITGAVGPGLLALVGVTHDDDVARARRLAQRIWNLRVFDDAAGTMNLSAADLGREVLVVSQFTLYGDTAKGRRPSYVGRGAARGRRTPRGRGGGGAAAAGRHGGDGPVPGRDARLARERRTGHPPAGGVTPAPVRRGGLRRGGAVGQRRPVRRPGRAGGRGGRKGAGAGPARRRERGGERGGEHHDRHGGHRSRAEPDRPRQPVPALDVVLHGRRLAQPGALEDPSPMVDDGRVAGGGRLDDPPARLDRPQPPGRQRLLGDDRGAVRAGEGRVDDDLTTVADPFADPFAEVDLERDGRCQRPRRRSRGRRARCPA